MFVPSISTLALVAASASVAFGQAVWDRNQVSTSICQWRQLRAAVIRDTVFLDGGELWWKPGLSSGDFMSPLSDNNPLGITWKLNLSKPFDTTGNFTEKLEPLYGNNGMPATNIAPNYFDGALLYNNDGWFYYGGLLQKTASLADPPGDRVRGYRAYSSKVDNLQPQFVDEVLDKGLTRYVAYGGAASAPSENKAWYFSGLRARNWGPVHVVGGQNASQAVTVVNSMVTVDMTTQQREEWDFKNLTDGVPGRANPELVWVPVGPKGILVVLGGVVDPDFVNVTARSSDDENNKTKSPEFMSTIDIYDIAGDKWYRQKTDGGPGALTRGCAVVAPAPDGSSFNIYYYGGYDGRRQKESTAFSDDVWVLSLPSFTWVKLHQGTSQARAGHKCVMPYPDQMIVIGGYPALDGFNLRCLDETVRVFNLTTGKWVQRYDPAVWSKYAVPDAVVEKIGGSPTGGATKTTPSPSFAPSLSAVFATRYPTSKITPFYPYASVAPINNTNPNLDPAPDNNTGGGGGLPSYLPPVLGVVLGLVFLTVIAVFILLWRRRRYFKKHGSSVAGTEDTNGHRIMNWIRNQPHPPPADAKTPTVASTTEYIPGSTTDLESVVHPQSSIVEMMNTEVKRPAELMDTSPPAELHDMPMTHIEVLTRHSHLGESPAVGRGAVNNGSFYSNGTNQIDHASTISHPVSAFGVTPPPPPPPPPPKDSPVTSYRPDSDALGNPLSVGSTPTSATGTGTHSTMRNAVLSGISNLSERDRSHLRQISDTTVSSITSGHAQLHQPLHADGRILSPTVVESPGLVTPPSSSALETDGIDYLSARPLPGQNNNNNLNASASSPLRRSVFTESRDDMSDPNVPGGGANRI